MAIDIDAGRHPRATVEQRPVDAAADHQECEMFGGSVGLAFNGAVVLVWGWLTAVSVKLY